MRNPTVIDLYDSDTPNGLKIRLFLAEAGLEYRHYPVRLSRGEQFSERFLAISPNAKIPAIVDHAPPWGGGPLPVFESAAILHYLADRAGRLLSPEPRTRSETLQWLMWQVSGLGPTAGQAGYFRVFAPEPVPAAIERYTRELTRLYGVLDKRLAAREWIAGGDYSIADIACYPWIIPWHAHGQQLAMHPHLAAWFERIAQRPATRRVYAGVEDAYARPPQWNPAERAALFGTEAQIA